MTFPEWCEKFQVDFGVKVIQVPLEVDLLADLSEARFRAELKKCIYLQDDCTSTSTDMHEFIESQTGVPSAPIVDLATIHLDPHVAEAIDVLVGVVQDPEVHNLTHEEEQILRNSIFLCFHAMNCKHQKVHAAAMVSQIIIGAVAMLNLDDYEGLSRVVRVVDITGKQYLAKVTPKKETPE